VVGVSRSASIRSRVDFPHPDGPMSETNAPLRTERSTPDNASIVPRPRRNVFETSRIEIPSTSLLCPCQLSDPEREDAPWVMFSEPDSLWCRANHPRAALVGATCGVETLSWDGNVARSCSDPLGSTHNVYTRAAKVSSLWRPVWRRG
jgi:hypothetical protein